MMMVSFCVGFLGLLNLLVRRSLLGAIIGVNLMMMGAASAFVVSGVVTGRAVDGHIYAIFVIASGAAQLVVGYTLAVRLFYLRRDVGLSGLRSMRG
ncbi:MAG TPA: NADH-quinone oxidoreductase subunit K [Bdellovibrionota bacterium]|jgi:NADH:ubiquinone oxidoreductase subunit K|nr:NADH-quinone oxidoreductase subunit K [Bdellovibrionota bacterium]